MVRLRSFFGFWNSCFLSQCDNFVKVSMSTLHSMSTLQVFDAIREVNRLSEDSGFCAWTLLEKQFFLRTWLRLQDLSSLLQDLLK